MNNLDNLMIGGEMPFAHERLVRDFIHEKVQYPHDKCLHQLFEEQVERTPDTVAVVFENRQLTYRHLNRRANQLARHLQLHGVGPDTLVGICLEGSLELLVAIFGVLKAGGAYVPLDPNYPPDRIAYMLEKTRAPVLIQAGTRTVNFKAPPEIKVVGLDADWPAIAKLDSGNLPACPALENLIYIIFTSGSTGQPKGAAVRHGGFSNLLNWFVTDFGINNKDRALICSSISFDLTQKNLYATLLCGGTLYLCPPGPFDATVITRLINDHGITLINCTPSAFYPLVEQGDERCFQSLASLRAVFLGGETISIPRIRPWLSHRLCHAEIVNTYGPTECTDICGFYRLTRENLDHYDFVPLGGPISNVQIVILDDSLERCPPGTPGELCIGGAGVGAGYVNDPETTAAKFLPNPFSEVSGKYIYRTGDQVRMLPDGNIEFLGRLDHQVKIRGFRVELGEIEAALNTHPNIQSAVVIAREDKAGEKILAAYLVPRSQPPPGVSELHGFLKARMPDYMVPAMFVTLKSFPLNPNGKVDRKALPVLSGDGSEWKTGFVAPGSPIEERLAAIWAAVFGQKQISISDNFFELGGHSLLAIKMACEIKRQMGFDLSVRMLYQHPTVRELAKVLPAQKITQRKPELIQLQASASGPEVFFLIDEGSLGLFKLSHHLGKDLAIFASVVPLPEAALRASAKKQFSALPCLEDLAVPHVALIKKRQTAGSLILAGHCFGGMLAFEVARQLRELGIPVKAVLLLDTWMAQTTFSWRKKAWLREHFGKLLHQGLRYLWQKGKRRIMLEKTELASRLELAIKDDFNVHVPWAIIARIYEHSMNGYRPKPLATHGLLFVSQDDWMSNAYRKLDDSLGANGVFTGGVEVVNVPGNHVTVLNDEHLPALAEQFEKSLKQF
jgi:amino acid adenylation domain-containing protein